MLCSRLVVCFEPTEAQRVVFSYIVTVNVLISQQQHKFWSSHRRAWCYTATIDILCVFVTGCSQLPFDDWFA